MAYNTWFTSDTHFNHRNILKYNPNRLEFMEKASYLLDVEAMNQAIVDNWNNVVKDGDTVFHLGDVAFGRPQDADRWVRQLKGDIILIKGNHDYSKYLDVFGDHFSEVKDYLFLRNFKNEKLVLFHYPITRWDSQFRGSYHLYGHVHGAAVPELRGTRSMDVGIDTHSEMRPYNWYEIKELLEDTNPPRKDHHDETRG